MRRRFIYCTGTGKRSGPFDHGRDLAPDGFNVSVISDYRITQLKPFKTDKGTAAGLLYDRKIGTRCSDYSDFRESISHDREQPLRYGYYIPQGPSKKKPLIIWLHGGGEADRKRRSPIWATRSRLWLPQTFSSCLAGAICLYRNADALDA
jgi:predicted peptidase